MSKRYDLVGQKFGRLTVVSKGDVVKQKRTWNCKCDCGNSVTPTTGHLNAGLVKSCGCMWKDSARAAGKARFIDLTGQKFERLTVLRLAKKARSYTLWECRCECRKIVKVRGHDLRTGNTKSCGCLQTEIAQEQGEKHVGNILANLVEGTNLGTITAKLSKNNTSGVKGVFWNTSKGRWEATLTFQGKRHYLGTYDKIEDATRARREAEEKYHIPIIEKYRGE